MDKFATDTSLRHYICHRWHKTQCLQHETFEGGNKIWNGVENASTPCLRQQPTPFRTLTWDTVRIRKTKRLLRNYYCGWEVIVNDKSNLTTGGLKQGEGVGGGGSTKRLCLRQRERPIIVEIKRHDQQFPKDEYTKITIWI